MLNWNFIEFLRFENINYILKKYIYFEKKKIILNLNLYIKENIELPESNTLKLKNIYLKKIIYIISELYKK